MAEWKKKKVHQLVSQRTSFKIHVGTTIKI